MQRTRFHSKRSFGFTIVEVAVIIVVIGILASIITFSIGSWRTRVAQTEVRSDLSSVRSAMDAKRNFSNGYPTNPSFNGEGALFQQSPGVEIRYVSGDNKTYCVEAQSKVRWQVSYFITEKDSQPVQGTCASGAGGIPVPNTPEYMIFVFNTAAPGCDGTARLPFPSSSGKVHWGDGVVEDTSGAYYGHTYAKPGVYTAAYTGTIPWTVMYDYGGDSTNGKGCIESIKQWTTSGAAPNIISYIGGSNLKYVAEPPSTVRQMTRMFAGATSFNQPIGDWDMSRIVSTQQMFYNASAFNQPIGNWNVSSLQTATSMFSGATNFNQPIGNWNTSNVTRMNAMFRQARAFNQPIGNWDTSKVIDMGGMFDYAQSFNQPIGNWNTAKVTDMASMFFSASSFNQPIGNWNTSKVTTMQNMFYGASSFNQNLSTWNVAAVTNHSLFDSSTPAWTLPRPNFP